MLLKLIKTGTVILALLAIGFRLHALWIYYAEKLPGNNYSVLRIIGHHVQFLTGITLPLIALVIILKSKSTNTFFLALFLAAYSALGELPVSPSLVIYVVATVAGAVTGIFFVISMQYFPRQIISNNIDESIKTRWLRWYLKWLLHPRYLWTYFFVLLLTISVFEYFAPSLQSAPSNFLILLTGCAYLYINFKLTRGIEHSRILWMFWGLIMYILVMAIYMVVYMYSPGPDEVARLLLAIVLLLILLFSFSMSLFFADAFNTGLFIRRTAVNALLFLLAVFAYNTLEHYMLHWISHKLHLSDALMSSLLSGLLVLCISPLHHRLTRFLNKKLKPESHSHH